MPKVKPLDPPVVQREGNALVAYLGLEGSASPAWIQIFETLAGVGFEGFEIGIGNVLPHHAGSPAIYVSIGLSELHGDGVTDQVATALKKAMVLADAADAEDHRRASVVAEVGRTLSKI
jgi:hypothetical protein